MALIDTILASNVDSLATSAYNLTQEWGMIKGLVEAPPAAPQSEMVDTIEKALNEGILKAKETAYLAKILSPIVSKLEGKSITLKTVFDEVKRNAFKKGIVVVITTNSSGDAYKAGDVCVLVSNTTGILKNRVEINYLPQISYSKWVEENGQKIEKTFYNVRPATLDEIKGAFKELVKEPKFQLMAISAY